MGVFEAVSSPGYVLSEQVARQIFDALPEDGPIVAIMNRDGDCWLSSPEGFSRLGISRPLLLELWAKVDDGVEPATAQLGDASVTAAQLATDRTNCGYVVVAQRRQNPESAMMNMNLIEVMLNQVTLIARLIERNNQLNELQMKHYTVYGTSVAPSN